MGIGREDSPNKERGKLSSPLALSRSWQGRSWPSLPTPPGNHGKPAGSLAANQKLRQKQPFTPGFRWEGSILFFLGRRPWPTACPQPPRGLGVSLQPLCITRQKPKAGSSNNCRTEYLGTSSSLATVLKPWWGYGCFWFLKLRSWLRVILLNPSLIQSYRE